MKKNIFFKKLGAKRVERQFMSQILTVVNLLSHDSVIFCNLCINMNLVCVYIYYSWDCFLKHLFNLEIFCILYQFIVNLSKNMILYENYLNYFYQNLNLGMTYFKLFYILSSWLCNNTYKFSLNCCIFKLLTRVHYIFLMVENIIVHYIHNKRYVIVKLNKKK